MRFDWVTFNPDGDAGDTVEALYQDKKLIMWGDEYHDKISVAIYYYIAGFNDAYTSGGINYNVHDIPDETGYFQDGDCPPEIFKFPHYVLRSSRVESIPQI